jgi:hypothetical protein
MLLISTYYTAEGESGDESMSGGEMGDRREIQPSPPLRINSEEFPHFAELQSGNSPLVPFGLSLTMLSPY